MPKPRTEEQAEKLDRFLTADNAHQEWGRENTRRLASVQAWCQRRGG